MAERNAKRLELGLGIGGFLKLQLSRSHANRQRFSARLIGFLEGESVVVTTPQDSGVVMPFYLNDDVAVRYLAGREIHGFNTRVIRVATEPYPHLHLAYPDNIERVPVRQEERCVVDLSAHYEPMRNAECAGEGRLIDLSAAGTLMETTEPIGEVGDEIRLRFNVAFAGLESRLDLKATIRNCKPGQRPDPDGTHRLYGLQFGELGEHDLMFIKGFVYEQIIQNRES